MGEAKRRKAILGDVYWQGQNTSKEIKSAAKKMNSITKKKHQTRPVQSFSTVRA